jgi:REP element-mobilizing transposase RayT
MKAPHAHDLRKGRYSEPQRIYLITTVTHDRIEYFRDFSVGRIVVDALRAETPRAATLAYVVMPDHLHWLVQLRDSHALSRVVADVKSVSAHRINQTLGREGQLWQPGFHDHALRRDEDLTAAARYLVANPLRAGLVQTLGDYPLWDAVWL